MEACLIRSILAAPNPPWDNTSRRGGNPSCASLSYATLCNLALSKLVHRFCAPTMRAIVKAKEGNKKRDRRARLCRMSVEKKEKIEPRLVTRGRMFHQSVQLIRCQRILQGVLWTKRSISRAHTVRGKSGGSKTWNCVLLDSTMFVDCLNTKTAAAICI